MINIYATIQEMLRHLPISPTPAESSRWVADFNAAATEIEENIQHDTTGAEDQVSLPPWFAQEEGTAIWLYTPPLICKGTGTTYEAIRLAVNASAPVSGTHVNARSVPVDTTFKVNGQMQFACIIWNTNADSIATDPLVAIWFLWDSIARLGITKALEHGLITTGWVQQAFEHANECRGKYPLRYYARGNATNEYLMTIYRLCTARGIDENDLHGEGSMDFNNKRGTDRTYRNTWIDEKGFCTCCKNKKPLQYGYGSYPYGSILGHVNSVRHCRNAAEYLLKMAQDEAIKQ